MVDRFKTKLSEKTEISLWLAVLVIGGGATWMTTTNIRVQASIDDYALVREELGNFMKEYREDKQVSQKYQEESRERMTRLETLLEDDK